MYRLPEKLQTIPLRWWQVLFWLLWLVATVLMLLPSDRLPEVDLSDKTEHIVTFAGLMASAWLGYRNRIAPLQLAGLLVGYGIAIECIQYFIPSRSFSVLDMLADTAGVLPVCALARWLRWP